MQSITKDDYMKALALWTMATDAYTKAREFEVALKRHLPECAEDRLSDSIYAEDKYTLQVFNDALQQAGVAVEE
jgi:hypothetical protein